MLCPYDGSSVLGARTISTHDAGSHGQALRHQAAFVHLLEYSYLVAEDTSVSTPSEDDGGDSELCSHVVAHVSHVAHHVVHLALGMKENGSNVAGNHVRTRPGVIFTGLFCHSLIVGGAIDLYLKISLAIRALSNQ